MSFSENLKDILGYGNNSKSIDLQENVKTKLLTEEFIKQIIIYRPYFGLKLISDQNLDNFFREEFSDKFFSNLLIEKNSILYREIANNQDFEKFGYKYELKEENKILKTIFTPMSINDNTSSIAEQLSLYMPIGNTVLNILKQHKDDLNDDYNNYKDEIIDISRSSRAFGDPVYVGICFFDIMIRESIYAKIEWHMMLFYYYEFTKQICINYNLTEESQDYLEFSNVYSYFLYTMIHNLKGWIKLIIKDTENVQQPIGSLECGISDSSTNANIIQSSIRCLVQCIKEIIKIDNIIPYKEKKSLTHELFNVYFDLSLFSQSNREPRKYGKLLLNCILKWQDNEKGILLQYLESYDRIKLIGRENVSNGLQAYNKLKIDIENSIKTD